VTEIVRTVQALIVVDMQKAFVSGDEAVPEAAGLLITVTDLMQRAREAGALVTGRRDHHRRHPPAGPAIRLTSRNRHFN
jgi:streptothricin hydrolase